MYLVYIGGVLCPVTPSKMQTKIGGTNKVITLINEGQVNLIKSPALTEVSFELLLPNREYSFAVYKNGFVNAEYFLSFFENLKAGKKTLSIMCVRKDASGKPLYHSSLSVTLEEYTINESAADGTDVRVQLKFRQYRDFGTKTYKVQNGKAVLSQRPRNTASSPAPKSVSKTYKVQNGDSLFSIAKYFYGNGGWDNQCKIINANKSKIVGQNAVKVGTVLTIPK